MAIEFFLGGAAASFAAIFSNPPEVIKTRMQLQGELQARGAYTVIYKNPLQAGYAIAKQEGLLALQKGLLPAIAFQAIMNSTRLGTFQTLQNWGILEDENGKLIPLRTIAAGTISGALGGIAANPFYLVKTHLQSMASSSETAVGHQYHHRGMVDALVTIHRKHGILGLWRGSSAAVPRLMVGSAAQLSTFQYIKENFYKKQSTHPWLTPSLIPILASLISSFVVVACMTPFDVVSTRLYNQPVTKDGQGLLYKGVGDAIVKIWRKERLWGFYKGLSASYFRVGPHNVICLTVWDLLRRYYTPQKES